MAYICEILVFDLKIYQFILFILIPKEYVDRNGSAVYCTGYERMRSIKANFLFNVCYFH